MGVLALALGNWQRVLALAAVAAFLAVGAQILWLKHQHKADQAALAHAHSELVAARAQARISEGARTEADNSVVVNRHSNDAVLAAQQEIANAQDAAQFYASWVAGIGRVRDSANTITA